MDKLSKVPSKPSTGALILATKSLRIRECADTDISKVLIKIFMLVGLVTKPDQLETTVLVGSIKNDLKKYGLDEIELAFRMALKGELYERINGKEEQLNINHYNNFCFAYICRVMNAYENNRRIALKKENDKPVKEKQPSEEDKEAGVKQAIVENFELCKKTGSIGKNTGWQYDILSQMKIIDFTNERKIEIGEECKQSFKQEQAELKAQLTNKYDIKRAMRIIEKPGGTTEFAIFCKKYALQQFFQDLIDTEQHIKELLK